MAAPAAAGVVAWPVPYRVRLALRLGEALVFSIVVGVLIWGISNLFLDLPLVWMVPLGFLSGGAATQRTFGVTLYDRGRRMALALLCALLAYQVTQVGDYLHFRSQMRRRYAAADYRRTPAEIDAALAADLTAKTGYSGVLGYAGAALQEGQPVLFNLRLRGVWLAGFWLAELGLALYVAGRWAAGPKPRAAPEGGS